jgi:ribosomal protein S18 acetylase RimI-like enzyme
MTDVNPLDISIRPATAGDERFLESVHREERHWEFQPLLAAGDAESYHKVMSQQYAAHHDVYFNLYDVARYGIVLWTDRRVGRLYVDHRDAEIRVLDMALLRAYRGRGIGTILMRGLCADAARRRLPVVLHVHVANAAAFRFYYRFGFEPEASDGRHVRMQWFHADYEALQRGQIVPPEVVAKRRLQARAAGQGRAT